MLVNLYENNLKQNKRHTSEIPHRAVSWFSQVETEQLSCSVIEFLNETYEFECTLIARECLSNCSGRAVSTKFTRMDFGYRCTGGSSPLLLATLVAKRIGLSTID
jgi:hypothetical protein